MERDYIVQDNEKIIQQTIQEFNRFGYVYVGKNPIQKGNVLLHFYRVKEIETKELLELESRYFSFQYKKNPIHLMFPIDVAVIGAVVLVIFSILQVIAMAIVGAIILLGGLIWTVLNCIKRKNTKEYNKEVHDKKEEIALAVELLKEKGFKK